MAEAREVSALERLQDAVLCRAGEGIRWLQQARESAAADDRVVLYQVSAEALQAAAQVAWELARLAREVGEEAPPADVRAS